MDVIDMEVKIKNNGEMTDATIEMVDGVLVVSPKVVKFEPKDGDIVTNGNEVIAIFKMGSLMSFNSYAAYYDGRIWINECFSKDDISLATEEEKKKFFDRLKEEDWEWDAEKKELVKKRWKPEIGEAYFSPYFSNTDFLFTTARHIYTGHFSDEMTIEKMRAFKTKDECQLFCDKLTQTIEEYEP